MGHVPINRMRRTQVREDNRVRIVTVCKIPSTDLIDYIIEKHRKVKFPPETLKQFRSFKCKICDVTSHSYRIYFQHRYSNCGTLFRRSLGNTRDIVMVFDVLTSC